MNPTENSTIKRIPETRCLNPECGRTLNAIGTLDGSIPGPQPGDPVACLRCGNVMTTGEDGSLRPFTDQEARELMADQEAMRDLFRAIGRIHAINVMTN
jgi:hypothetical protein